ncbi:MAG TPA: nucleotidyltransferase domain-containing protein [Armatimonadota bacterium]|nr:nucleotidyltransferase domain-containing protein [Armatimonadota bacterium]
MLTQADVDSWLEEFHQRVLECFGERLIFLAHHGSWARGEARPDSDIDAFVIVDHVDDETLLAYRKLIDAMPLTNEHMVSTFFGSTPELSVWPRHEQIQCWFGCKILHGDLADLVEPPTDGDFITDVRLKASDNLHMARHYLLHPHDMTGRMRQLAYPFKEACYAMQSWMHLTTGIRYDSKLAMLDALEDETDREVVLAVRNWQTITSDKPEVATEYAALLERWARAMLERLVALKESR